MEQPQPFRTRKSKNKKNEALWMLSFSDMCLILMCFFALIISMSTVNSQKFDNVAGNLSAKVDAEDRKEQNLKAIQEHLKHEINRRQLKNHVTVNLDADGLSVEFKDQLLFRPGSADPNPEYRATIQQVMRVLANAPERYQISLEGHTDDVPMSGRGRFRSNWELSAARSVSLLNEFRTLQVDERRMHIEAYAHTRPKIAFHGLQGQALAAARAANRRVVIRLH